ncbi:MAG: hypothetical protein K0R38_4779 [Polyangiaceae bacterium]|jgi:hypothetical protein|nr:hypothetical protein [Polyangiaceae bacterium]
MKLTDPQLKHACDQLGLALTAFQHRAFELYGVVPTADDLVSAAMAAVARFSTQPLPTGPIVSLAEARAAKTPVVMNQFNVMIPDLAQLDSIAIRLHGEASHVTRSLVAKDAFERGLAVLGREP